MLLFLCFMFVLLFYIFCSLFCVFCVFVLFSVLVLFVLVYIVVGFLFMYKFTDYCHLVESHCINIISYESRENRLRETAVSLQT